MPNYIDVPMNLTENHLGGEHVHGENCDHGHDEYDEEDDWHLYSRNFFFDLLTSINFIIIQIHTANSIIKKSIP